MKGTKESDVLDEAEEEQRERSVSRPEALKSMSSSSSTNSADEIFRLLRLDPSVSFADALDDLERFFDFASEAGSS